MTHYPLAWPLLVSHIKIINCQCLILTINKSGLKSLPLEQSRYYILSSNRAWGSIIRVPEKYPQMSQFYQDLLAVAVTIN
jgi:hypothetical protein